MYRVGTSDCDVYQDAGGQVMEEFTGYIVASENFEAMVLMDATDILDLKMRLSQMYGIDLEGVVIQRVSVRFLED